MLAHCWELTRSFLPLAAVVAFAVGVPFELPGADLVGGHCNLAMGCNNSTWNPCQGAAAACQMLWQCECNGAGARCAATTSCKDLNVNCSPATGCFCAQNDMCLGL